MSARREAVAEWVIADLGDELVWLPMLARWHYDQWGPLTGASSCEDHVGRLTEAAASRAVPSVLVAVSRGELLGSVSLLACDLPARPELTPWLAQLFVEPTRRSVGLGAAFVRAALQRAGHCGHRRVDLYTSGTLPDYYGRLGWRVVERLDYLERPRTVMVYDL
jgi:predicted N-acetyltransferase YhbS